jgi:hypothetical protein
MNILMKKKGKSNKFVVQFMFAKKLFILLYKWQLFLEIEEK